MQLVMTIITVDLSLKHRRITLGIAATDATAADVDEDIIVILVSTYCIVAFPLTLHSSGLTNNRWRECRGSTKCVSTSQSTRVTNHSVCGEGAVIMTPDSQSTLSDLSKWT